MNHRNPHRLGDAIIFWVCLVAAAGFVLDAMYRLGVEHGRAEPKKCATVQGMEVVSSSHEFCTYANSFGRSTTKRRAT